MQIICATPQAAADVLAILFAAHVDPLQGYTIQTAVSTNPPLIVTMAVGLPAAILAQIRAVADTTIDDED